LSHERPFSPFLKLEPQPGFSKTIRKNRAGARSYPLGLLESLVTWLSHVWIGQHEGQLRPGSNKGLEWPDLKDVDSCELDEEIQGARKTSKIVLNRK